MTFRFSMRSTWRLIWSVLMTIWRSTTGETRVPPVSDASVAPKSLLQSFPVATKCSCVFSQTTQCRREALRLHTEQVGTATVAFPKKPGKWVQWHSGERIDYQKRDILTIGLFSAVFRKLHSSLIFTSSSFWPSNFVVVNSQNVEEVWKPRSRQKISTLMPSLEITTTPVAPTVCGWSLLRRVMEWRSSSKCLRSRRKQTAGMITWSCMTVLTSSLRGWDDTVDLG